MLDLASLSEAISILAIIYNATIILITFYLFLSVPIYLYRDRLWWGRRIKKIIDMPKNPVLFLWIGPTLFFMAVLRRIEFRNKNPDPIEKIFDDLWPFGNDNN